MVGLVTGVTTSCRVSKSLAAQKGSLHFSGFVETPQVFVFQHSKTPILHGMPVIGNFVLGCYPIVRFSSVSRTQAVMFPGPTVRLAEDVKHKMIAEQSSFCLAETTNWQHYTASLIRRDSHQ